MERSLKDVERQTRLRGMEQQAEMSSAFALSPTRSRHSEEQFQPFCFEKSQRHESQLTISDENYESREERASRYASNVSQQDER
jgi:hypothetical protein